MRAPLPRIIVNPRALGGKPVIRGTRISVELLLRDLAEGATVEQILAAYPTLVDADVRAAIAYAADSVSAEETVPVAVVAPKKPRR